MRVSGGGEGRRVFLIKKANRLEKMQINNIFTGATGPKILIVENC
jgi:hypothetical protein